MCESLPSTSDKGSVVSMIELIKLRSLKLFSYRLASRGLLGYEAEPRWNSIGIHLVTLLRLVFLYKEH